MKIDIQPGDTFTINESGALYQYRGKLCRGISWGQWNDAGQSDTERDLDLALAKQIIAAAGHTIEETQPQAAPVPWPTHAVVDEPTGTIIALGDEEACRTQAVGDIRRVRPLAPAPVSPDMVKLLKALDYLALSGWHDESRVGVREAIKALLAEGGGQ